eukprot:673146-Pyramimonas_sp.AAC.1
MAMRKAELRNIYHGKPTWRISVHSDLGMSFLHILWGVVFLIIPVRPYLRVGAPRKAAQAKLS